MPNNINEDNKKAQKPLPIPALFIIGLSSVTCGFGGLVVMCCLSYGFERLAQYPKPGGNRRVAAYSIAGCVVGATAGALIPLSIYRGTQMFARPVVNMSIDKFNEWRGKKP